MKKIEITDLVITDGISKERFNLICTNAFRLSTFTKFLIGDIVNVAKKNKWTDSKEYQTFVLGTGYKKRTLEDYALVASRIPLGIRLSDVSFAHHSVIARLDPSQHSTKLLEVQSAGTPLSQLKSSLRKDTDMHPLAEALNKMMEIPTPSELKRRCDEFIAKVKFYDGWEPSWYKGGERDEDANKEYETEWLWFRQVYDQFHKKTSKPIDYMRNNDDIVIEECKRFYKEAAIKIIEEQYDF